MARRFGGERGGGAHRARWGGGLPGGAPGAGQERGLAVAPLAAAEAAQPGRQVRGGGLGNLGGLGGGLPEGLTAESLAEQLSKMPSDLSFPAPNQGPQGNVPAAFRGGNKRKKK